MAHGRFGAGRNPSRTAHIKRRAAAYGSDEGGLSPRGVSTQMVQGDSRSRRPLHRKIENSRRTRTPLRSKAEWRRGWDLNPRYPCRYAAFRVRCIRPLCHLSAVWSALVRRGRSHNGQMTGNFDRCGAAVVAEPCRFTQMERPAKLSSSRPSVSILLRAPHLLNAHWPESGSQATLPDLPRTGSEATFRPGRPPGKFVTWAQLK